MSGQPRAPLLICPWPCLSHAARMPQLRLPQSTALFFPIPSHVTMGELLNPLEPQFIYQQKGYSTLPSVPLSKVYLQHLQYNVGLSAFGHTHTHTHTTSLNHYQMKRFPCGSKLFGYSLYLRNVNILWNIRVFIGLVKISFLPTSSLNSPKPHTLSSLAFMKIGKPL